MIERKFSPNEIIFSPTNSCNLRCSHCYVEKENLKLSIDDAIRFLESCDSSIEKIGFSGGEPFLYKDFICKVCEKAIEKELYFDRIMTNGIWWNDENILKETLEDVFSTGFDGKIGLSFDTFHNQNIDKLVKFISTVYEVWNDYSIIEIQSVINELLEDDEKIIKELAVKLNCEIYYNLDKKSKKGIIYLTNSKIFLPIFRISQCFESSDKKSWKDKHWFKDDYCESTGQILFIHSNGFIAPCCGFANENKALFIGNIKESYSQVIENAKNNKMVNICYIEGLKKYIKKLKKKGLKFYGKTKDPCTFCDYLCKLEKF